MSYLVFARKWRPLNFDDVVGQEHITGTLKKAIEKNRVAHAYIFSGTRGVGKTTTARILARALNCEKGPTPAPCGVCGSCKGIINGSSFDVLEIDGASNNSVDDIRELRDNVGYTSMGGKYRIFVIDEVHMLSKPAFNALLKTLEEPPPNVIFIFATTEPQKIPATIHSRCQRYDFKRIVPEQILERLVHICTEEKITFDTSALMLIARKAEGSMRDALSLLDQVCSYCPDRLAEQEVRRVLGLVGMEVYERVMDAVAAKAAAPALSAVQEVLYQGFDLHEFVLGFEEHVRNLLFSRINGALQGAAAEPETIARLKGSSERFSEGDLLRMMEIIHRAQNDLKWSAQPRFAAEMMLLKIVFLDNTVSIERFITALGETAATIDKLKYQPAPEGQQAIDKLQYSPHPVRDVVEPAPAREQASPKPLAPAPVQTHPSPPVTEEKDEDFDDRETGDTAPRAGDARTDMMEKWRGFIESLMRDRPNIGTFLSLAAVTGISDASIDCTYPPNLAFQFAEVTKKQNREEIGRRLQTFMGRQTDVNITLEPKKTNNADQKYIAQPPHAPHAAAIEGEIEREPIIKSVLDIFDGEILK